MPTGVPAPLAPLPALLRAAWSSYRVAVRQALAEAGYEDLPRNGAYMLAGLTAEGAPLAELIGRLGVSKQAAGQLVDLLVLRAYLERRVDPQDRRRLIVTPTARGTDAAAVVIDAVEALDARLQETIGARRATELARSLKALAELGTNDA